MTLDKLGLLGYGHLREARLSGGALALHPRLQTPSFCSGQGRLFFSRQARFFSGGHPNEPGTRYFAGQLSGQSGGFEIDRSRDFPNLCNFQDSGCLPGG